MKKTQTYSKQHMNGKTNEQKKADERKKQMNEKQYSEKNR